MRNFIITVSVSLSIVLAIALAAAEESAYTDNAPDAQSISFYDMSK